MKRRQLLKSSLALLPLVAGCQASKTNSHSMPNTSSLSLLKPPRLREGDLVSLVAPSGPVNEQRLQTAVENLEGKGFRVDVGKHILALHGHNAGTDAQRLADLHAAFAHKESKAVWCIRGGDGAYRLLPQIDYALVRQNPKWVIGYSDVTALLLAFYRQIGLVGMHGPIAASSKEDFDRFWSDLSPILYQGGEGHTIQGDDSTLTFTTGVAEGALVGGNLSLLAALAGTPYAMDAKDKIVFIEDVGEEPRRVDRMLCTLRQACRLEQAAGIIFGKWIDCECELDPNNAERCLNRTLPLKTILTDHTASLGIPVLHNFPFGHGDQLCSFPVGIRAYLDAGQQKVRLLETAVG